MAGSRQEFRSLLEKYKGGQCDRREVIWILEYIRSGRDREYIDQLLSEGLLDDVPLMEKQAQAYRVKTENVYRNIERHIDAVDRPVRYASFLKMAIAAMVLLAVGIGSYLYLSDGAGAGNQIAGNDLEPGGNHATLTLANGERILLDSVSNGQLAEDNGIKIAKTGDGQIVYSDHAARTTHNEQLKFNSIQTPRGGQYKIILPDSSCVWLNAASSLKYPTRFSGAERRVELSGEAYFEVARANVPFVVATEGQEVAVLGTHFNIDAYRPGETRTTLMSGKVKVSPRRSGTLLPGTFLQPGRQAVLTGGDRVQVVELDDAASVATWREGIFSYSDTELSRVLDDFARWYDIEVSYTPGVAKLKLDAEVRRDIRLSEALYLLEQSLPVKFQLKERRLMAE